MRSSIACSRCRRSKVKCVNNGVNTTCRACENTGRECTYPSPALTGGQAHHVRREGSLGRSIGADGLPANDVVAPPPPRRSRPKKPAPQPVAHPSHNLSSIRALVDALDPQTLTPKVWIELFDIYQLHFATEMPFLHPPTFLKPLRQASAMQQSLVKDFGPASMSQSSMPDLPPMLLLAFLALTARFHPTLIAHHSPATANKPSNPRVASEYYAAAAKAKLVGKDGDEIGTPEIERVHALLMLTLHDWGNCEGAKAWMSLGSALRYAQLLGLQYEDALDDQPFALSQKLRLEPAQVVSNGSSWDTSNSSDAFIEQEIRRRTYWSIFVMDRYLSSGKYRPHMVHAHDLHIQLPSSERAFLFGEKVRTLMLGEEEHGPGRAEFETPRRCSDLAHTNGEQHWSPAVPRESPRVKEEDKDGELGRWEVGPDEGLNSRFVKALELFGKLVKWTCSGGRRTEKHPPWDSRSSFAQLRQLIKSFEGSLPRDMTLSPVNISAHITGRTSTPYTLLHATLLLCNMILHREQLPFVPLRCAKPDGPLDPPDFPSGQYSVPQDFWYDSARQVFRSARDTMNLVRTCQEWGNMVETPLVGFAVYTAAFAGVYAINFPWMDTEGYMSSGTEVKAMSGGAEISRKALETIGQMRPRLKMADGWFKTIARTHLYFMRLTKDFRRNVKTLAAQADGNGIGEVQRHLTRRESGAAGRGGDASNLIRKTIIEFGNADDDDIEMEDAPPAPADVVDSKPDPVGGQRGSGSPDIGSGAPGGAAVKQGGWASINMVSNGPPGGPPAPNGAHAPASQHPAPQHEGFSSAPVPSQEPPRAPVPFDGAHPQAPSGVGPPSARQDTIGYASVEDARNANLGLQQHQQLPQHSTQLQQAGSAAPQPPPPPPPPSHEAALPPPLQQPPPTQMPQQQQRPGTALPPLQQPWTREMEQEWLDSIETRFSADDVAAFVDGYEWQDWAALAAAAGSEPGGGWLSAVWS